MVLYADVVSEARQHTLHYDGLENYPLEVNFSRIPEVVTMDCDRKNEILTAINGWLQSVGIDPTSGTPKRIEPAKVSVLALGIDAMIYNIVERVELLGASRSHRVRRARAGRISKRLSVEPPRWHNSTLESVTRHPIIVSSK